MNANRFTFKFLGVAMMLALLASCGSQPPKTTLNNPSSFTATVISKTQVDLSWSAVTGATTYRLERKTASTAYILIQELSARTFSDTTVSANIAYTYRVTAKNSSASASGVTKAATTPSNGSAPTTVTIASASSTLVLTALGLNNQLTYSANGTDNSVVWSVKENGVTVTTNTAKVLWVDKTGNLTALAPGTAVVYATSVANPSIFDTLDVQVNPTANTQSITGTITYSDLTSSLQVSPTPSAPSVAGEFIVKYKDSLSAQSVDTQIFGKPVTKVRSLGLSNTYLVKIDLNANQSLSAQSALEAKPEIEWAEPNYILHSQAVPNDPNYAAQWNLTAINMPTAWDVTKGSSGVIIADVDSGVIKSHPDLAGKLVSGYDFVSDISSSGDGNGRDSDPEDPDNSSEYHGTHVAGIMAATTNNAVGISGVAWNSKVLPVRVLGNGTGTTVDIIDGMLWAAGISISGVPTNANPAKVINLSLGGEFPCNNSYQTAINQILAKNIPVVVAAGNSGIDASRFTPASCAGVITVGATGKDNKRPTYSNFGSRIAVMAPGGDLSATQNGIYSLTKDSAGQLNYGYKIGTSMAAPQVSGLVALMLSKNSSLTPADILSILKSTATAISTANCGGVANACGAGLINAKKALDLATPPASLTVGASPSVLDFNTGKSATTTVTITKANISGSTLLSITPALPAGVTHNLPASTSGSSISLTFSATNSAAIGSFPLTLTASAGGKTATIAIRLNITSATVSQSVKNTKIYACALAENVCKFVSPDDGETPDGKQFSIVQTDASSATYTLTPAFAGKYVIYAEKASTSTTPTFTAAYTNTTIMQVQPGSTGIDLKLEPVVGTTSFTLHAIY